MVEVSGGSSGKNWIRFYTSNNAVTAIRNSDGEITFEFENQKEVKASRMRLISTSLIILVLPLLIKILVLPLIRNKAIGIICYLIPALFYFIIMVISINSIRKDGGKELLRNHAAEHMVFAAYKRLKRVPTVKEAKWFPWVNKNCGASLYSSFITFQLIGWIIYANWIVFDIMNYKSYVLIEIGLILCPIAFSSTKLANLIGNFVQKYFTTAKPKNQNIELAINAIFALELRELLGKVVVDAFCKTPGD